jgi:hypothetical protein
MPSQNGVGIVDLNRMENSPNYPWSPAQKLVFPQIYARWKKKCGDVEKGQAKPLTSAEWEEYAELSGRAGRGEALGDLEKGKLEEFRKRVSKK